MPRSSTPKPRHKAKAPPRKRATVKLTPPPSSTPDYTESEADFGEEEEDIPEAISTEEGLRFAGYLSPETRNMDPATQKWCICGIDPAKQVDMETMIRCDHRACDPGWYHLSCVQLTEHPLRHLSWFCPRYIAQDLFPQHRSGVVSMLSEGGFEPVEIWWEEEKARRARKGAERREILDNLSRKLEARSARLREEADENRWKAETVTGIVE